MSTCIRCVAGYQTKGAAMWQWVRRWLRLSSRRKAEDVAVERFASFVEQCDVLIDAGWDEDDAIDHLTTPFDSEEWPQDGQ